MLACIRWAAVLNFPDSAPPPQPGSTTIRTDEQKMAALEALAAEYRRAPPKASSCRGVSKHGSKWRANYHRVWLGLYQSEEEGALVYDQALLHDLGRCVCGIPAHWERQSGGQARFTTLLTHILYWV